jgi:hypothetical protein
MTVETEKNIETGKSFWTTDVYSYVQASESGWYDGNSNNTITPIIDIIVSKKSDGQWYGIGLSKEDAKRLLNDLSSLV